MQRFSCSLWAVHRLSHTNSSPILLFPRYRSTRASRPRSNASGDKLSHNTPHFPRVRPSASQNYIQSHIVSWANSAVIHDRLESFGVLRDDLQPLLQNYANSILSNSPSIFPLERTDLLDASTNPHEKKHNLDTILSSTLIRWASSPSQSEVLRNEGVSEDTLSQMARLAAATDLTHPSEWFPLARQMRRKIIMHVGPTNSGKTHNALRALAAANRGLYAGPLRLLAHEIWERLNLGQIVPLGIHQPHPLSLPSTTTPSTVDIGDGNPPVRKDSNKSYVRQCNLITGEEQKIVSPHAPLVSCTVEMANLNSILDVAVIDEIQMISDPDRGNAWTTAVLGLPAHELHLCGEETAVPIIQEMVKETGDELFINRYKRLSPLVIEEESLHGDFGGVKKGDCFVTFSRKGIHKLKQQIETSTNFRCALAYGKLPPEIRSEQAALFNDPNSGYDVIVGSDALGMGLNLKIKRIIFETLTKWDGEHERPLSVSQVKQIAGRAGRYGLHGSDPGGTVTTLAQHDLPTLHDYLSQDAPVLSYARILASPEKFSEVVSALPPDSNTATIYSALIYLCKLGGPYAYSQYARLHMRTEMIDRTMKSTIDVKAQMMMAPIPWRDDISMETIQRVLKRYGDARDITADTLLSSSSSSSSFKKKTNNSEHADALEEIERLMEKPGHPERRPYELLMLESLHNLLVFYMWMSFRNPVMFHDFERVQDLKERTEVALEYCLEGLTEMSEEEVKAQAEAEAAQRAGSMGTGKREKRVKSKGIQYLEKKGTRTARQEQSNGLWSESRQNHR